jgi:PTS system nitrogen regulatory IIA component
MLDLVLPRLRVGNKEALLSELAKKASPFLHLDSAKLLVTLQERERIGCTGIGHGVALPHARLAVIEKPFTIFARLAAPIEYDAVDDRRVDLVYLLLGPEVASEDHLCTLAHAARTLRNPTARLALREAKDEEEICKILCENR